MPAYRVVMRTAAFACLFVSVLLSASCGCGGGGSKSTPSPGKTYQPDPIRVDYPDPVGRKYITEIRHRDHRWHRTLPCERLTRARLIRERWLAGAGYLADAEHRNVTAGSTDGTTDWRSLMFNPRCGSDCRPDNTGAALAIYAMSTDMLGENQTYLDLTWENRPGDPDNCWVAIRRPGQGEDAWNWFKPGEEMRVAVTPISQYQHQTTDEKVYIAVVLTGMDPAVLRKVALCEYEANVNRRYTPCRDYNRYEDNYLYDEYRNRDGRYRDDSCRDDRYRDDHSQAAESAALLTLTPNALPGDPPDSDGAAEVIYTFQTDDFGDNEVYVELDWYRGPVVGDCWVGVFRPRAGEEAWNWFKPGADMRVALSPIDEYKSSVRDEPVYVKVVVTGNLPCELEMVTLREFEFDFID